jgi:acetyl esterase/lipase
MAIDERDTPSSWSKRLYNYIVVLFLRAQHNFAEFVAIIRYGSPTGPSRRLTIQSAQGRSIRLHLYEPPKAPGNGTNSAAKPPVHINWHGSGFVIPSQGEDAMFCALVARETGAVVVDADYAKGPEHPFPAAPEDAAATLAWVAAQGDKWDTTKISLGGFSAGANLALCLAAQRSISGGDNVKAVIAAYPPVDFVAPITPFKDVPSLAKGASGFIIPTPIEKLFHQSYIPRGTDRTDPRLSPFYVSPKAFPPTTLVVS